MVQNVCPGCGAAIAVEDINIAEGAGLCRACGKLSRLGEIADASEVPAWRGDGPTPAGCRVDDLGSRIVVRATTRSIGAAMGSLFFCLFWNGIVSVFVLIAISGLYTNLVGPLPAWFPAPSGSTGGTGGTGGNGQLGPNMPLGMTLFLCVFLTPFVTIGLAMIGVFLTCLAGEVRVTLEGGTGRVRTGIGPFAWRSRFDAAAVRKVTLGHTTWKQNDQAKPVVVIEADKTVRVGSMLTEERRAWMLGVLRTLLVAQR